MIFNVNTFLKLVPASKIRVTYDLHRHHKAQNYWTSGEPPLPRYAYIYRPSEISSFTVISISKQMLEVVENVFTLTVRVLTQTAEFCIWFSKYYFVLWKNWFYNWTSFVTFMKNIPHVKKPVLWSGWQNGLLSKNRFCDSFRFTMLVISQKKIGFVIFF